MAKKKDKKKSKVCERPPLNDRHEKAVQSVLAFFDVIGEDPSRSGIADTPTRVFRAWEEMYCGYNVDIESMMRVFDGVPCDEMIILKDIEFYSTCEHHLLPFFGKAHVAYIPKKGSDKVVGISKLGRLVDAFARRLQVQERIATQVVDALDEYLSPLGAACTIQAKHFCMMCRGVEKQHSTMICSKLSGVFRQNPQVRAEYLSLIGS